MGLVADTAAAATPKANPSRSVGAALQKDCGCTSKYRTETLPPTPEVIALFDAAEALDEKSFDELLIKIPDVGKYLVDDRTLITKLLQPHAPEPTADGQEPETYWKMSEARRAQLFAEHRATWPTRTRMLAAALKRGARPNDTTYANRLPGLHLAVLFGSPAMVDLLLASGADANQGAGTFEERSPIETMFHSEYVIRLSHLPDLVTRSERSTMLLSLTKAGAKLPFSELDAAARTLAPAAKRSAAGKKTPQPQSVAADYLLWAPLVEMTEGPEVLSAFLRMGTQPVASAGKDNQLARAALAGNTAAVQWLQQRLPRYVRDDDALAPSPPILRDTWAEAAWAALGSPFQAQRAAIFELLVDGKTDVGALTQPEFSERYLVGLQPEYPETKGHSLLSSAVATGDVAIVDWLDSTGVLSRTAAAAARRPAEPANEADSDRSAAGMLGDALVDALALHRADLVQRLLAAGAPVLVPGQDRKSALSIAIDPDSMPGERRTASTAADQNFFDEVIPAMLATLKRDEVQRFDTEADSPLAAAIASKGPRWREWADKLVAAGFSLGRLPLDSLVTVLRRGDVRLAMAMLDAGLGDVRKALDTPDRSIRDDDAFGDAVYTAATLEHWTVLERLLTLRKPAVPQADWQRQTMVLLASKNNFRALDILKTHGWVFDREATQLALDTMWPDGIANALKYSGLDLSSLCLSTDTSEQLPLLTAVYMLPEPQWQRLLADGLAGLPSCADDADSGTRGRDRQVEEKGGGSASQPLPMTALAAALLQDPFAVAGERRTVVPRRIAELRRHGMAPTDVGSEPMTAIFARAATLPQLLPTLRELGADAGSAPIGQAAPPPSPPSLRAELVGTYHAVGTREAAIGLQLQADGRFEWAMSYGASDRCARGSWRADDGKVVFESDPVAPFDWFKITGYTQYAEGDAAGQATRFDIDVAGARLDSIDGKVFAGPYSVHSFTARANDYSGQVAPKTRPTSVGLWFRESQAPLATELPLPNVERLKSVSIALQRPNESPASAFHEIMQIEAGALVSGRIRYERAR